MKTKQAFTLTELLVVVVIIGVLAAVVLPKFTHIVEARKTVEAERMMRAVRTEQEARCTLGKPYRGDLSKVKAYQPGKNFDYSFKMQEDKAVGMIASAKGKEYKLEMPSYADGRICCSGDACADLGKKYPLCTELEGKADYVAPNADCGVVPTTCTGNTEPLTRT